MSANNAKPNPNNTFMYDISDNVFDRDESSYRREHAQITSEFERIRPMFAQTAGFNNKLFNKVFDHIKASKGPAEESIDEPESMYDTRMPTYGTAEDGGQNMLKEDREIRGMTQLERAYRSHTNPDEYNESTIERCKAKPDFKERPLTSQEAKQKIDAYRQIVPNPQMTPDSRPQIQIQPVYPTPAAQAQPPQFHQQAQPMQPQFHPQAQPMQPQFHPQTQPMQTFHPQMQQQPMQPQFHPQAQPQFRPQTFNPQAQPQFHPQAQPQFRPQAHPQAPINTRQPIEYQTDFQVRPPSYEVPVQLAPVVARQSQRRSAANRTAHGPDDYRFYTDIPDEREDPVSVEQDLTELKKMVKKQELLIKLLLARSGAN